ncbi:MAG: DNA polymerase III subunit delta, partial [Muribaculaceae bacterium]|nr:DNA polymerase III subunit delta [Muribaculaceae bacterium]
MASKTQISDFRKIMTEIRKGNFAPVYLLMGEEAYYIDRIVEALEQSVVAEDERDFNMTVLYGQDTDVRSVIAACQQYPFMADRK